MHFGATADGSEERVSAASLDDVAQIECSFTCSSESLLALETQLKNTPKAEMPEPALVRAAEDVWRGEV